MYIEYDPGPIDYSTYMFSYQPWFVLEEGDRDEDTLGQILDDIYMAGGLPYTGAPRAGATSDIGTQEEKFYMARSLRVDLAQFVLSSENKRVLRKNESLGLQMTLVPKESLIYDEAFHTLCEEYYTQRFDDGSGKNAMTRERFEYVLSRSYLSDILMCTGIDELGRETIYGYIILVTGETSAHYRYALLDTPRMYEYNLGKRLMTQTILRCKEQGYAHLYLGTCYGEKSKYKMRDFKALEFRDGREWNGDMKELKRLMGEDG